MRDPVEILSVKAKEKKEKKDLETPTECPTKERNLHWQGGTLDVEDRWSYVAFALPILTSWIASTYGL